MRLRSSFAIAWIAVAPLVSVHPAAADPAGGLAAVTGEELAGLMRSFGYNAEVSSDPVGNPQISSTLGDSKFIVRFNECDAATPRKCATIRLYSGYLASKKTKLDLINRWNRDNPAATAFLDKDGDPCIQADIPLTGGVSAENLKDRLARWAQSKSAFEKHINF